MEVGQGKREAETEISQPQIKKWIAWNHHECEVHIYINSHMLYFTNGEICSWDIYKKEKIIEELIQKGNYG